MSTFDATLRSSVFWLAVLIPPTVYWVLVQLFALQAGAGMMSPVRIATLIALAQALPLTALLWMLCSVAAYTIAPGKLIEHRVVKDREFVFGPCVEVVELAHGGIAVRLPDRTLRLHVTDPVRCLALLREAVAAAKAASR